MSYYGDEDNIGYAYHPVSLRKIKIRDRGTYEWDTNAYTSDSGYPIFEYDDTGEELSDEELNEEYGNDFIHEYLYEKAEWT